MRIIAENIKKEIAAFIYPVPGNDRYHQQTLQAENRNQSVNIRPALERALFRNTLNRVPLQSHLYFTTNISHNLQ